MHVRQRQRESGQARFETYEGVWGFWAAVIASLIAISGYPAEAVPSVVTDAERDEQFRVM